MIHDLWLFGHGVVTDVASTVTWMVVDAFQEMSRRVGSFTCLGDDLQLHTASLSARSGLVGCGVPEDISRILKTNCSANPREFEVEHGK